MGREQPKYGRARRDIAPAGRRPHDDNDDCSIVVGQACASQIQVTNAAQECDRAVWCRALPPAPALLLHAADDVFLVGEGLFCRPRDEVAAPDRRDGKLKHFCLTRSISDCS